MCHFDIVDFGVQVRRVSHSSCPEWILSVWNFECQVSQNRTRHGNKRRKKKKRTEGGGRSKSNLLASGLAWRFVRKANHRYPCTLQREGVQGSTVKKRQTLETKIIKPLLSHGSSSSKRKKKCVSVFFLVQVLRDVQCLLMERCNAEQLQCHKRNHIGSNRKREKGMTNV